MMFSFDHGVSATRNGREVLIHGAHQHVTYRLHGRAARYARRIMRRGMAHLPDDLETWELVSLGIIVHDPDGHSRQRTRRAVSGGLLVLGVVTITAWLSLDGSPSGVFCPLPTGGTTLSGSAPSEVTSRSGTACPPMLLPMRPLG